MKRILSFIVLAAFACGAFEFAQAKAGKSMVGQKIPDLKLDYIGNKPDVQGKPMILEFWATWCGPCKQSIPHLNQIHKKYKDKGLVILGVTDENEATVRGFTKKVPIDYASATDPGGKLSKDFGVQGIPHAVLVKKSGEIAWEGHPLSLKDADIEKLFE